MRSFLLCLSVLLACAMWATAIQRDAPQGLPPPAEKERSPIDLALVPGGRYVVTANHTADSVSLIDLAGGRVIAEQNCGRKPAAVACSRDGKRVAASNLWSGTVSFFELQAAALRSVGQVKVGPLPRGLIFAPDGNTLYVAVAGADEIVQVDRNSRTITWRISAPHEPRHLVLSSDGKWLAAASSRSGHVRCWDTRARHLHWERKIEDGFNLRSLAFSADGRSLICPHSVRRSFPVSQANIAEGWVIDSRLSQFPVDSQAVPPLRQIALDERGKAVGDPYGLAVSTDGRRLAVTGSGTHELLIFETAAIPWEAGDPGDVMNPDFLSTPGKLRRVSLGGRPMTLAFLDNTNEAIVANYLLDAVQIVDCKMGKVVRSIPLASPLPPSLARKGEALFYDAQRSHDQWFSCSTCHVEGHTCGLTFDTLNDDSYGNPKLTPTLRNVVHTGPWTWHGWQKDLGAAVEKSLTQTMFGPRPTAEEKEALLAFLATLEPPPNPHASGTLSEAARRGAKLFHGKANCIRCHKGKYFTSSGTYDVGLEPDGSPYLRWNPPALVGLWERAPYLHDGRAESLGDLLKTHHVSEKLGGERLTIQERHDLIEYLNTL